MKRPSRVHPIRRAAEILLDRSEEKQRQYGNMHDNLVDAAIISSRLRRKSIDELDVLACLVGIKLAREAHCHKEDNIVDVCAYIGAYHDEQEIKLRKERSGVKKTKRHQQG